MKKLILICSIVVTTIAISFVGNPQWYRFLPTSSGASFTSIPLAASTSIKLKEPQGKRLTKEEIIKLLSQKKWKMMSITHDRATEYPTKGYEPTIVMINKNIVKINFACNVGDARISISSEGKVIISNIYMTAKACGGIEPILLQQFLHNKFLVISKNDDLILVGKNAEIHYY